MLIPTQWRKTLDIIQELSPTALLAGGCMRDLIMIREPKDLDVFVPHGTICCDTKTGTSRFVEQLKKKLPQYNYKHEDGSDNNDDYEDDEERDPAISISHLFESSDPSLLPLNIIECAEGVAPIDRFRQFDFGLCQAAYNGKRFITTTAFHHDKDLERFTLMRAPTKRVFKQSLRRYRRIVKRYAGFPLVIPDTLELPL